MIKVNYNGKDNRYKSKQTITIAKTEKTDNLMNEKFFEDGKPSGMRHLETQERHSGSAG